MLSVLPDQNPSVVDKPYTSASDEFSAGSPGLTCSRACSRGDVSPFPGRRLVGAVRMCGCSDVRVASAMGPAQKERTWLQQPLHV